MAATVTITKALTNYFNVDGAKLKASDWLAELKKLTPAEKLELATLVVAETGDTLSTQTAAK